jgi:hypothetical protein
MIPPIRKADINAAGSKLSFNTTLATTMHPIAKP